MNGDNYILDRLRDIYQVARERAKQPIVPSEGRGKFRFPHTSDRNTELSRRLLTAFDVYHNIELVLQKTIVEVMNEPLDQCWFNSFNVAGGWCGGGVAYNCHAVDIGRVIPVEQLCFGGDQIRSRYKLDLFELKRWDNKTDDPFYAASELFTSFSAFWNLVLRRNVSPYEDTLDCNDEVRLAVMAPEQYFGHWGCDTEEPRTIPGGLLEIDMRDLWLYTGNRIFVQFHDALNLLKQEYPELMRVSFHPHAVVLKEIDDKEDFVDVYFDWESLSRHGAADTTSVALKQGSTGALRQWVTEALDRAYMNRA